MSSTVTELLQLWSSEGMAKGFGVEQRCVVIQMAAGFSSCAHWYVWRRVPWSPQSHRFVYLHLGHSIMHNSWNRFNKPPMLFSGVSKSPLLWWGISTDLGGGWGLQSRLKELGIQWWHHIISLGSLKVLCIIQSLGPNFQRCCCPSTFQAKCSFHMSLVKGRERQWVRRSLAAERRWIRKRKEKWNGTNKIIPVTIGGCTNQLPMADFHLAIFT